MSNIYAIRSELYHNIGVLTDREIIGPKRAEDETPLKEFIRQHSTDRLEQHMRIFIGPYWPIEILDSMSRWLTVVFPVDALRASGAFGTAVKVSDALRWLAEEDVRRADYLVHLAGALDAQPSPRPAITDPTDDRNQLLLDYMSLTRQMIASLPSWSDNTLHTVKYCARAAAQGAEWGTTMMPLTIPFPSDLLPAGQKLTKDGYDGMILRTDWLLRNAVKRANYLSDDERKQIMASLMFYPSPNLTFSLSVSGNETDVGPLSVVRNCSVDDVADVLGSVHLDHLEETGRFSQDPEEFPFRVYRSSSPRDDDEPEFYLVSDQVIYHA
ncbi:MAG: hypothetical protein RLP98_09515 [Devosia sp.]